MAVEFDGLRDFAFGPSQDIPLQTQLYQELKTRILNGRLVPEMRLPSTRSLSQSLSVSRNTVNGALEQLKAEGYIKTKPGAGHYVSDDIPDNFLRADSIVSASIRPTCSRELSLSSMGQSLMGNTPVRVYGNGSFEAGVPDLQAFPLQKWGQIYQRHSQRASLLGYDCLQGYEPLRHVLAEYLRSSRGLLCSPDQVIITVGAQQAASIAIQILLENDDEVYVENPGYIGMRKAFEAHGVKPVGIPVGEQGIDVAALPRQPTGKLLCLTPTHQYPMGGIIPLANRLKILQWAADNGIWVLEDDYDSEYHYDHKPIAAMQGLGLQEQVIYIGSFSKVLYPGLRLGYLVVPERLVGACVKAKNHMAGQTAIVEQATTAEFIETGQFVRHIRKMRMLYKDKQRAILDSCREHLADVGTPQYTGAGMHIVLTFRPELCEKGLRDVDVVKEMTARNIFAGALSAYYLAQPLTQPLAQPQHQGVVLGFANTHVRDMSDKIKVIRQVIDSLL
ncbi:hypothetical protein A9Q99_25565 [Gammaproteobacteria bacterium 45_16_T64]|nr:hypothetical protein A9Q99_25565 [Gammaproteobacteria bacterium 45_16_T64]